MNKGTQRFYLTLLVFMGVYFCVSVFTMRDYALSWDEPTRWNSGNIKIDYYERLFASDDVWETMQKAGVDVYPGLYDVPLAIARQNLDVDPILLSRIWNSFFGGLALFSTIMIARRLTQRFSFTRSSDEVSATENWVPFVAGICLLCIPEFYGHIFINPKDVPFAATYGLATLSLINLVLALPHPRKRDYVFFGIATGLVMGMRPPGIVFLGYYAVVMFAWSFWFSGARDSRDRLLTLFSYVWRGVLVAAIAWLVVFPLWPALHRNPFTASATAVSKLHTVSGAIPLLFRGEVFDASETPFYYVIWMFFIKMPIWQLLLIGIGVALNLTRVRKSIGSTVRNSPQVLAVLFLVFSVLFPMCYVLVKQPSIHNGFRHMFNILPAVAVLMALSWQEIVSIVWRADRWRWVVGLVTGACLFGTLALYVLMHPYQYVYYNSLVGGPAGSLSRYESDYWFTAGKEAIDLLQEELDGAGLVDSQVVRLFVTGPWQVLEPYLPENYKLVESVHEADFFVGNTQMRADLLVEGEEVVSVQRMGLPLVVVKRLAHRSN